MATAKAKLPPDCITTALFKGVVDAFNQGGRRAVFTSSRVHHRSWIRSDKAMRLYT